MRPAAHDIAEGKSERYIRDGLAAREKHLHQHYKIFGQAIASVRENILKWMRIPYIMNTYHVLHL